MLTNWCVRLITPIALFAATAAAQVVVLTPTSTIFDPAGGTLMFNASVSYSAPPSALAFSASIPAGWSYVSTGTGGPNVAPLLGDTGTLSWIYTSAPPSPVMFSFTVAYPASVSGVQPLTSNTISRDTAGSPGVTTTGPAVTLTVPSNSGVWSGNSGNWTDPAQWTGLASGVVPNNSGGTSFGAKITAGTATVISPVSINDLLLIGGTISNNSTLTIAGSGSDWEAGVFSGVGTLSNLVIAPGAFLTATTSANHDFPQTTITNQGQFIWNGSGSLRSGNGGAFVNASGATFTDASGGAPAQITSNTIGGSFSFTNLGTYLKSGNSETRIDIPFINQGTLFANAGNLHFGATFNQSTGNIIVAAGATAQFDQGLNLAGGSLIGSGTIAGNVIVPTGSAATFISPGSILGQLTVQGDLTLASTSQLLFDLGNGTVQGTSYDFLSVTGRTTVAGTLTINLVNGAQATIPPNYTFTLINSTLGLSGRFANAPDNTRFFTTDLQSSFLVTYTGNSLSLTNFVAVPEPSTWALLFTGLGVLGLTAWRRRP